MNTDCTTNKLHLKGLGRRRVEADFGGGQLSSDGGGVLLREVDHRLGLVERMAECFKDFRDPELVEHSVQDLLRQRIYGLVLGYEDLNDHERLSRDPLLATLVEKEDPKGESRRLEKDFGQPLASASTLGRLERTKEDADEKSRYEKIVCDFEALRELFVRLFIESFEQPPLGLVIDLDPSDIPLHGNQEERFFHGYYGHYCYLPMYMYCGEHPLMVQLRPSNIDGSKGSSEMLEPLVRQLREAWPHVHLIVRGDSGFCRDSLMSWCEAHDVDYVFGMARNSRLERAITKQLEQARREHLRSGKGARRYRSFRYRTLESWSRARRVIGKAEYLAKGRNPRFVVSSLPAKRYEKAYVYEELYCVRGEMENRIKEQQLDLFGDRASSGGFRGNELRSWLSMAAQLLVAGLRRLALQGTELAHAQANTIRVRLLKIGAAIRVSVRRVFIQLSTAFPLREILALALERLRGPPGAPC